LNDAVARYDREGFQIMLHAIGDRAIRMTLDAYDNAAKMNTTAGRRHRIEHIEVPDAADLPRFARLGVIASTQATFAEPDENALNNYAPLLGTERARMAMPFRKFDEAGVVQAFGSDFAVFSMDVLRGIYIAVTRMTPQGTPAGGWYPENRIYVEAALRHFTRDAAYASFGRHSVVQAGRVHLPPPSEDRQPELGRGTCKRTKPAAIVTPSKYPGPLQTAWFLRYSSTAAKSKTRPA
jgi:predicted amidohydrolase YtcJ